MHILFHLLLIKYYSPLGSWIHDQSDAYHFAIVTVQCALSPNLSDIGNSDSYPIPRCMYFHRLFLVIHF